MFNIKNTLSENFKEFIKNNEGKTRFENQIIEMFKRKAKIEAIKKIFS